MRVNGHLTRTGSGLDWVAELIRRCLGCTACGGAAWSHSWSELLDTDEKCRHPSRNSCNGSRLKAVDVKVSFLLVIRRPSVRPARCRVEFVGTRGAHYGAQLARRRRDWLTTQLLSARPQGVWRATAAAAAAACQVRLRRRSERRSVFIALYPFRSWNALACGRQPEADQSWCCHGSHNPSTVGLESPRLSTTPGLRHVSASSRGALRAG